MTGRADLGDGSLEEVTSAVVLVAPRQLAVPLALPQLHDRVEVAVVGLGAGQQVGDTGLQGEEVLVSAPAELPRGGLEPLVDVGVSEDRSDRTAVGLAGEDLEIVQVARAVELLSALGDRVGPVRGLPRGPQATRDVLVLSNHSN